MENETRRESFTTTNNGSRKAATWLFTGFIHIFNRYLARLYILVHTYRIEGTLSDVWILGKLPTNTSQRLDIILWIPLHFQQNRIPNLLPFWIKNSCHLQDSLRLIICLPAFQTLKNCVYCSKNAFKVRVSFAAAKQFTFLQRAQLLFHVPGTKNLTHFTVGPLFPEEV